MLCINQICGGELQLFTDRHTHPPTHTRTHTEYHCPLQPCSVAACRRTPLPHHCPLHPCSSVLKEAPKHSEAEL